jgi:hypothetical protein
VSWDPEEKAFQETLAPSYLSSYSITSNSGKFALGAIYFPDSQDEKVGGMGRKGVAWSSKIVTVSKWVASVAFFVR